jgi:hypothetical protein
MNACTNNMIANGNDGLQFTQDKDDIKEASPLLHPENNYSPGSSLNLITNGEGSGNEAMHTMRRSAIKKVDRTLSKRTEPLQERFLSDTDLDALTWDNFEQCYEHEVSTLPAPLRFPEDDISLDVSPRPLRTVFSVMTSSLPSQILDPVAKATISVLSAPYTTVIHRYKSFGWKKISSASMLNVGGARNSVALSSLPVTTSPGVKRSMPGMPTHSSGPTLLPRRELALSDGNESTHRAVYRKLSEPPMPHPGPLVPHPSSPITPPGSPTLGVLSTLPPAPSTSSPHMSYKSSVGILRVSGELSARNSALPVTDVEYAKNPNAPMKEKPEYQDHVLVSSSTIDLLIELKELKFQLELEPLFCTLAIYDMERRTRISENFHFTLNSKHVMSTLDEAKIVGYKNTLKKCIVRIPVHGKVHYVVRVLHPFRGDIQKDIKPYFKLKSMNHLETIKREIKEKMVISHQHSHIPLQHLAWTSFPVFFKAPSSTLWALRGAAEGCNVKCDIFFPAKNSRFSDDVVHEYIGTEKEMRKHKVLPGMISMAVSVLAEGIDTETLLPGGSPPSSPLNIPASLYGGGSSPRPRAVTVTANTGESTNRNPPTTLLPRLSPSLLPVKPFPTFSMQDAARELQEFSNTTITAMPCTEFINNLYIYPEFVYIKFNNPNLQIKIQLVENLETATPLNNIYSSGVPDITKELLDPANIELRAKFPPLES